MTVARCFCWSWRSLLKKWEPILRKWELIVKKWVSMVKRRDGLRYGLQIDERVVLKHVSLRYPWDVGGVSMGC